MAFAVPVNEIDAAATAATGKRSGRRHAALAAAGGVVGGVAAADGSEEAALATVDVGFDGAAVASNGFASDVTAAMASGAFAAVPAAARRWREGYIGWQLAASAARSPGVDTAGTTACH